MIILIELKKVPSVKTKLNAKNLKWGAFVCVARVQQAYQNEMYPKL